MIRPKKKILFESKVLGKLPKDYEDIGFNECHDLDTKYIEELKKIPLDELFKDSLPSVEEIAEKLLRPSKSKEMNVNFGVVNEYKARYLAQAIHDRL